MKKLVIEMSDEQHQQLLDEIARCQRINFEEETFSGMQFTLNVSEDQIFSSLNFKMNKTIELGDVTWRLA